MTKSIQTVLPGLNGKNIAPPRPKYWTKAHIQAAAEALLPRVIEWLGKDYRESEEAHLLKELADAIDSTFGDADGYKVAKHLEDDQHWDGIDRDLVETLDDASYQVRAAYEASVQAWVRAYDIKPSLGLGSRIKLPAIWFGREPKLEALGTVNCEVVDIETDQARYLLNAPALGHVPSGQLGCQGVYLAYEKVEDYLKEKKTEAAN